MSRNPAPDTLIGYLLGELSEGDEAALDQLLFEDDEQRELVEAAGDDLVDAYVAGRLPPGRVARFEERLLPAGAWKSKVAFARALALKLPLAPAAAKEESLAARVLQFLWPNKGPAPRFAVAAALAMLILAVTAGPRFLTHDADLSLAPIAVRGSAPDATVALRRLAVLRLTLAIDPDERVDGYRVVIARDGKEAWTSSGTLPSGVRVLVLEVPAAELEAGAHEVTLSDASGKALAFYAFVAE